jgi:Putative zinc-binding metallo-peptidase
VHREQLRIAMDEPYRTLLGHFRHEIGHAVSIGSSGTRLTAWPGSSSCSTIPTPTTSPHSSGIIRRDTLIAGTKPRRTDPHDPRRRAGALHWYRAFQ